MVVRIKGFDGRDARLFFLVLDELFGGLDKVGDGSLREDAGIDHVRDALVEAGEGWIGRGQEARGCGVWVWVGREDCGVGWVSRVGEDVGRARNGEAVGSQGGGVVLRMDGA